MQHLTDFPQRIMIFGRPGSGKSTFAARLHHSMHYPLYHLDKYYFTHYWQKRPSDQFKTIQENFIAQPQWIIDGNSLQTLDMRYAQTDRALCFLLPRWLCSGRIVKRYFTKTYVIDDRADNCVNRLNIRLFRYMWTYEKLLWPILSSLQQSHPHVPLHIIRSDQDAQHIFKLLTVKNSFKGQIS